MNLNDPKKVLIFVGENSDGLQRDGGRRPTRYRYAGPPWSPQLYGTIAPQLTRGLGGSCPSRSSCLYP